MQFETKSWQSRNRIIGEKDFILLTVPTLKKKGFQKINEVEINNTTNWKFKHFKSIEINYKKSSFFKIYIKFFEELYSKDWKKICNLNIYITNFIIKELGIETKIFYDTDYSFKEKKTGRLIEMCKQVKANSYLSNLGSQSYVDLHLFKKNKLDHFFIDFISKPYRQKKTGFIPNLTVFDMLFFCGKEKTIKAIKSKDSIKMSKNCLKLI